MIVLRHLLNFIWPSFTPFEKALFEKLGKSLDKKEADILFSQLDEINFVQRHRGDVEICFYKVKNLSISLDRTKKFPSDGEVLLCKCIVKVDNLSAEMEAWLVNGNLFSLEFSEEMECYRNTTNFDLKLLST